MALRPVNRVKHVIDSLATIAKTVQTPFVLSDAVDNPVTANIRDVAVGSKINGFYIRIEVASNDAQDLGAIPNCYLIIYKNPGGNLTMPSANAVGASDNKKWIIHQEMTMIENTGQGGNPRTIFNGVVVVPKGMRRNAPNDRWTFDLLSPVIDIAACMQVHYKEFR